MRHSLSQSISIVSSQPVTRRAAGALLALGGASLPVSVGVMSAPAVTPDTSAAWLRSQQLPDGSFAGFSGEADPDFTSLAILALSAAGTTDPANAAAIDKALAWLEPATKAFVSQGPGPAAIAAAAAIAGRKDPSSFGGVDLVAAMTMPLPGGAESAAPGLMGNDVNDHAEILIGMAAAAQPVDPALMDALTAVKSADGGWSYDGQTGPDVMDSNTTALVIQAYAAVGYTDESPLPEAVRALERFRVPGGGFAYQLAEPLVADANSTALVIQALIAAGEDPSSERWGDAPAALARFANPDGSFLFMEGDEDPSLYAALQAIPALAGSPYPVARLCEDDEESDVGCISLAPAG